jgi:hypothetical protein
MTFFVAVCENASVNEQDYGSQFRLIDGLTDFNGDGEGRVAGWVDRSVVWISMGRTTS